MKRLACAFPLLWALGCGPDAGSDESGSDSTTDGSTSGGPTSSTTSTDATTSPGTTTTSTTSTTGSTGPVLDIGDVACDLFAQDCPEGFKCMPYSDDGMPTWNATKCSPVAPDPNGVGEPCIVEDSGVSGVDDCDATSMCFYTGPDSLEGECVAFCTGTPQEPMCEEACDYCSITNDGVLTVCLPTCDPLAQDCDEETQACMLLNDRYTCVANVGRIATLGEPCTGFDCEAGLQCVQAQFLPGCTGSACCAEYCDTNLADGCTTPGQTCTPVFEEPPDDECIPPNAGLCLGP